MKKLFFTAIAVLAFSFVNAQEGGFKAGAHLGLPIGTAGDIYSFNFGVDVAYLWPVGEDFKAGVTTGYSSYSGKTVDGVKYPSGASIPLAATAQYSFSDHVFGGLDLGYAIYSGSGGGNGGLLYQPKVGYQTEKMEYYVSYKGVSVTGGSIATVGVGFAYKF